MTFSCNGSCSVAPILRKFYFGYVIRMTVANRISQSNSDGAYLHCAVVPDLHDKMILEEKTRLYGYRRPNLMLIE